MKRLALAAVLLVAAGCGGSERLPLIPLDPPGRDAEGVARVIGGFLDAARQGDIERMRELLSPATRASFGPGALEEVAEQLAELSVVDIVLARGVEPGWSVAAVAATNEDGEAAAWAAALSSEGIELGAVFFTRFRPAPLAEVEPKPEVRVEAQAGDAVDDVRVWVDGRELRAHAFRRAPFTREVWGRLAAPLPEGEHILVAFARAGDTAGAFAWPFEVRD